MSIQNLPTDPIVPGTEIIVKREKIAVIVPGTDFHYRGFNKNGIFGKICVDQNGVEVTSDDFPTDKKPKTAYMNYVNKNYNEKKKELLQKVRADWKLLSKEEKDKFKL